MGTAEKYYNDLIITWGSITMYIAVLPVVYGLFRWRYLNKPLRIYWYFLLVSLILYAAEQVFIWSTGQHYEMWKPWLTSLDIDSTNFFGIGLSACAALRVGKMAVRNIVRSSPPQLFFCGGP
jgi:hypothetical protein